MIPQRCIDIIPIILSGNDTEGRLHPDQPIDPGYHLYIQSYSILQEEEETPDYEMGHVDEGMKRNESKKLCHDAIELIEEMNSVIPEGKYLELVNILGEIHKRQ